jgi:NADP-dependent 3-hydroxy acid dehydrogenase YdfG
MPQKEIRPRFRPDASYLLVGGLGGIGQAWALRMIELGAKNLIFMSPSGARSASAKAAVDKMRQLGAAVHVFECDVADKNKLSSCLTDAASLPPIKGLFHAGSNFASDLFSNMTAATYATGLRPKVHATWNLHELLPRDMDHFVLFSSAAGIVGNASQAAYTAASSFQDAFAAYRREQLGLPAVSVDLGMVGGVGHVARHVDVRRSLEAQGYAAVSPEECMAVLEAAVARPSWAKSVVAGVGEADGGSDSLVYGTPVMSLLRRAAVARAAGEASARGGAKGSGGSAGALRVRALLKKATTVEEVEGLVSVAVLAKTCSLLMVTAEDVDVGRPMSQYGLDSLIAVVSCEKPPALG